MPRPCPEELLAQRLLDVASGFERYGAAYWPGADHFILLALDAEGSCTGEAWTVCRTCVRHAGGRARRALAPECQTMLD